MMNQGGHCSTNFCVPKMTMDIPHVVLVHDGHYSKLLGI